ncbi:MAG: helix-turn-helix domain-containing protein [Flavobacteriaceae bacterium]|nr:helix-turn-helix domain-containing protein [Flavobacteriaceae bacterium]
MKSMFCDINELRALSFFSTSLYSKETVDEVLWDITKNVVHRLGLVDCVIYTYDKDSNQLVQRAAYGAKNPTADQICNQIALALGQGIVGSVAQQQRAEIVLNTSIDPRYIVDDAQRLSEICVPIILNGTLFGVIDAEHPEKDFFTEKHLYLLNIIAALCAQKMKDLSQKRRTPFTKANQYFRKLETLMRKKKMYRDPYLSLASTAESLGISACYLSSMVNHLLKKSFIDFVNEYRIADVKRNLHSEEFAHYTVVSLGLEAGFNSKSTFYSTFKKHTGLTPLEYKKSYPSAP